MQFSIEVGELVTISRPNLSYGALCSPRTGIVISQQKKHLGSKYEQAVYEVLTNDGVIVKVPGTRLRKAD